MAGTSASRKYSGRHVVEQSNEATRMAAAEAQIKAFLIAGSLVIGGFLLAMAIFA